MSEPLVVAGSMAESVICLRDTVAALPEFQNRATPAYDLAGAKTRIYFDIATEFHDRVWERCPYAVIKFAEQGAVEVADGVAIDLLGGGGLVLALFDNARFPKNHGHSTLDFLSFAGSLFDAITEQPGYDDTFPINAGTLVMPPMRTPRVERRQPDNDYWACAWTFSYGEGQ